MFSTVQHVLVVYVSETVTMGSVREVAFGDLLIVHLVLVVFSVLIFACEIVLNTSK